jgi:hypothetical protein
MIGVRWAKRRPGALGLLVKRGLDALQAAEQILDRDHDERLAVIPWCGSAGLRTAPHR